MYIGENADKCINLILSKGIEELKKGHLMQDKNYCNTEYYNNPLSLSLNNTSQYNKNRFMISSPIHQDNKFFSNSLNNNNFLSDNNRYYNKNYLLKTSCVENKSIFNNNENKFYSNSKVKSDNVNSLANTTTQKELKFKEMKKRFKGLQSKLDKQLTMSQLNYNPSKSKRYKTQNNFNITSNQKQKNNYTNANKISDEIWEKRFIKLKVEFDNDKKTLLKLRHKQMELKQNLSRLTKKEKQYNDLLKTNQERLENNEKLFNLLEESDNVRNEQEKLIDLFQKKLEKLRNGYNMNNIEVNIVNKNKHKIIMNN